MNETRSKQELTLHDFKERSRFIKDHPAWALNDKGFAKIKILYRVLCVAILTIWLVGIFDPAQVILVGSPYLRAGHLVYMTAVGFFLLTLWVFSGSLKGLREVSLLHYFGLLFVSGIAFLLILDIGYRAIPKIALRTYGEPATIEMEVASVRRDNIRRSILRLPELFWGENRRLIYEFEGQPYLVRYRAQRRTGFTILPPRTYLKQKERAKITGKANWFGLMVERLEKLD